MNPINKFAICFFTGLLLTTVLFFGCWYVAELYMTNFGTK